MAVKQQSLRDQLRAVTVGSKNVFKSKVLEHRGLKFEIRQPSIAGRKELRKKLIDEEGSFDVFDALVWMVILYTFVPGTNERVFDEEDYDTLVAQPTGGYMETFSLTASDFMSIDPETIAKNSEATENDSSSSSSPKK